MGQPTDDWDLYRQHPTVGHFLGWLLSLIKRMGMIALLFILIQLPPEAMVILKHQPRLYGTAIVTIGCFILIFVGIILWAKKIWQQNNRTVKRSLSTGKSIGYVIWGYVAIYAGQIVLGTLNIMLYHQTQTANNNEVSKIMANNMMVMVVFGLSTVLLTPIAEELIFRGVLTNLFFKPNQFWPKLILSGFVFSIGHMSTTVISFLIYFYMGMVLAFLYQKTGQLKLSIALHGLNNLIAISQMIMILMR
ncbi:abortive infection protein [Paucilactobacillus vaccinostercus DSM 20634]|uniref:Abortive infection protein n=1 Tax=Paucilactobacillus vaccinostercus DSM 20634 TaxID=1423813 RepID=A0A0R2AB55_9LACO|nr:type II CAAX endopeptidase family protein [Paucilactobacillus vaccinostercus]KRM60275.1 abortive infection protein [Paucilactobacillus vaccinostercus DSM 20634]